MADTVFHVAADVVQLHAGLYLALNVGTRFAVHLGGLSVALNLFLVAKVTNARLLTRIH